MKKCVYNQTSKRFFKLVANDQSDKRFLLTSKFCPLGLSAPDLRLINIYYIVKSCVQSQRLKRFFWNLQQMTKMMRPFCWYKNFGPNWLSVPAQLRGIYIYKSGFMPCIYVCEKVQNFAPCQGPAVKWALQDGRSSGSDFEWKFHLELAATKYWNQLFVIW